MKADTAWNVLPSACNHWPPMLAVIPTERGYKVRCLTCGRTGPERASTDGAWVALMNRQAEAGEEGAPSPREDPGSGDPGGKR